MYGIIHNCKKIPKCTNRTHWKGLEVSIYLFYENQNPIFTDTHTAVQLLQEESEAGARKQVGESGNLLNNQQMTCQWKAAVNWSINPNYQ